MTRFDRASGALRRLVCTSLLATLALAGVVPARAADPGAVTGTVSTAAGRDPLVGATVSVKGTVLEASTDRTGAFRLEQVPPGRQTIEVSYLGYDTATVDVEVAEGAVARADVSLETAVRESVTVVDEPILESQASALSRQRDDLRIASVVASDQIGRFPDPNAAEALQHLPGVAIQRDQGEGRYVQIRGADPRLNSVLVNGERVPSPDGETRQVALDVIPADQLQAVVVSKTLTPDLDGDSIGGAVNLLTRQAPDKLRVSAAFGLGFNNLNGDDNLQGSLTLGRRFFDSRLGVVGSASVYKTDRASDNFEAEYDDGFLDSFELRDYTVNRKRSAVSATVDYDVSPSTELVLSGIFNDYRDQEYRRAAGFAVSDGEIERSLRDREEIQRILSINVGGEHRAPSGFRFDYRFTYGYAEENGPGRQTTSFVQEAVTFAPNVGPGSIDPDDIRANPLDENFDASLLDEVVRSDTFTSDRDWTVSANARTPILLASGTGIQFRFGGKYRNKTKFRNDDSVELSPEDDIALTSVLDRSFDAGRFLDDRYDVGPFADPDRARALLDAGTFEAEFDREEDAGDFRAKERVAAAYAMAEVFAGERFALVPGVRYEHTDVDYRGFLVRFDEDGDYAETLPTRGDDAFGAWLPSVNARYRIGENTNLRFAATRSLARPNYYDLVPYELVLEEDGEIERGNPSLVQTTSWNFDALAERYFETVGVAQVGFFYKRLDDFIFRRQFEEARADGDFDVIQPQNGERARIAGVELNYQNNFRKLPRPFDGLGVLGNYTYTSSEASIFAPEAGATPRTLRLPGQAEHVGNAALTYERAGFSGVVSWNYQGRYLEEVGDEAIEDIFVDEHLQLDLSLSQRVAERWRVFAQFVNLTNEPLRRYVGSVDRPVQQEFYSYWATFGVRFDF